MNSIGSSSSLMFLSASLNHSEMSKGICFGTLLIVSLSYISAFVVCFRQVNELKKIRKRIADEKAQNFNEHEKHHKKMSLETEEQERKVKEDDCSARLSLCMAAMDRYTDRGKLYGNCKI